MKLNLPSKLSATVSVAVLIAGCAASPPPRIVYVQQASPPPSPQTVIIPAPAQPTYTGSSTITLADAPGTPQQQTIVTNYIVTNYVVAVPAPVPAQPVIVEQAPPPAQVEVIPVAPAPDYLWVPGYWHWQGRWLWITGRWSLPPHRGAVWIGGRWSHRGRRYVWMPGRWR